ncbi:hypothetical protein SRIMM317S_03847 [Streptomyces rimosus subsp. rimosus]
MRGPGPRWPRSKGCRAACVQCRAQFRLRNLPVFPGEVRVGGVQDDLPRLAVHLGEDRAQRLVPRRHIPQGREQRLRVHLALQAQRQRHVVRRRRPLQLVQEPQPALREGQGQPFGACHRGQRGAPVALAGLRAEAPGQGGGGRVLEHVLDRGFGAQYAADADQQPDRGQRMAAEREEVVVRADVRHPQHLGEECAQRLLARPGRSAVRSGSGRVRCRRWRGVQLLARFPGGSCPCGGRAAGYGGAACGGQGRSVVGGAGTVMRAAWPGGRPGRVPRNTGSYVRVRIRNSRTAMGDTRAGRARGRETPGRRPREDARVPGRRQPERFGERGAVLDFRCAGAVGRGPLRLTRAISQSPVDMHTACIRSGQPMPDRISCESTSHPGRRQGRSSPHPVKSRTPSGRPAAAFPRARTMASAPRR